MWVPHFSPKGAALTSFSLLYLFFPIIICTIWTPWSNQQHLTQQQLLLFKSVVCVHHVIVISKRPAGLIEFSIWSKHIYSLLFFSISKYDGNNSELQHFPLDMQDLSMSVASKLYDKRLFWLLIFIIQVELMNVLWRILLIVFRIFQLLGIYPFISKVFTNLYEIWDENGFGYYRKTDEK
jgi:hypothetical protein